MANMITSVAVEGAVPISTIWSDRLFVEGSFRRESYLSVALLEHARIERRVVFLLLFTDRSLEGKGIDRIIESRLRVLHARLEYRTFTPWSI